MQEQKGFLIADLGGGTLDFSAYEVTGVSPLRVQEMAAARCTLFLSCFSLLRQLIRNARRARRFIIRDITSQGVPSKYVYAALFGSQNEMNVPSEKLQNTKYGTDEHINLIATRFDEAAKRTFRSY